MGPRRIRRGALAGLVFGCRRDSCFNGATTNSPWSTEKAEEEQAPITAASMGPRRIRRGARDSHPRDSHPMKCFNGATTNSPWSTSDPPVVPERDRHGFNGATTNSPWSTTDGEQGKGTPLDSLQWGHDEFAVEHCSAKRACSFGSVPLQWGHDEFAVEHPGTGAAKEAERFCFNGATTNSPWSTQSLRATRRGLPASMGPRRIRRGAL